MGARRRAMTSLFSEIVLFSPVKQDPEILSFFLTALRDLSYPGKLSFWFYDDNHQEESSQMLRAFCQECNGELLSPLPLNRSGSYKSEDTHHWNPSTVDRVIAIKNLAINVFLQTDAEYLFLLDSDVILQPFTLEVHLESNAFVVC